MGIYQHFREDERPFIDQVLSWKKAVERTFVHKLTDFLDPREQHIIESLIGSANQELILAFSGEDFSERKRAIIAPYYEEVSTTDFQVVLLETTYHTKFISLSHPDVMGAFLSLGLKRDTLGDIHAKDGVVQFAVTREVAPYVLANLTDIKNARLTFQEVPYSTIRTDEKNWSTQGYIVSSLRLDTILKEI